MTETKPTTGTGSERTSLRRGDPVRIRRDRPASGTFARYVGRTGWVATVHRETFPSGASYVEVGVSFLPSWSPDLRADAWFRADEVERAHL